VFPIQHLQLTCRLAPKTVILEPPVIEAKEGCMDSNVVAENTTTETLFVSTLSENLIKMGTIPDFNKGVIMGISHGFIEHGMMGVSKHEIDSTNSKQIHVFEKFKPTTDNNNVLWIISGNDDGLTDISSR
jgi:hypothetical protein